MGEPSALNGVMGAKAQHLKLITHHNLGDTDEAFGYRNWLCARVSTVAELEKALDDIEDHDGAAYIEVMIPDEESQPLPDHVIDRATSCRRRGRRRPGAAALTVGLLPGA